MSIAISGPAIVQDEYGTAPEEVLRLEEIARPAIADDEIRFAGRVRRSRIGGERRIEAGWADQGERQSQET